MSQNCMRTTRKKKRVIHIADVGADIFATSCEAIVNPVNTVGVMGTGLAAKFKRLYPDNFTHYAEVCRQKKLVPGGLCVTTTGRQHPAYIINFATKDHWLRQSKLEDIRIGMNNMIIFMLEKNIRSVAIPALGCGEGRLAWEIVRPVMQRMLQDALGINAMIFPPHPRPVYKKKQR